MFLYKNKEFFADIDELTSRDIPFEKLNNKTVMITGANGMLAYCFTLALMHLNIEKGYNIKVVALVRNVQKAKKKFEGFLSDGRFVLLGQDICTPIDYYGDVNYIFHAAGNASPYFIKNDPVGIIAANTQGTVNVLEFARNKSIENIVFASTREVYGKVDGVEFISEDDMGVFDPLDARSCYPESKRMAETIFRSYNIQYGVPFTVTRIAHSYGPGMIIGNDGRVMADFISDTVAGRNIILKSDGLAERAFCYVTDAVAGIFLVMLKGEIGEAYNIANETEPMAIRNVAIMLSELFPEKGINVAYKHTDDSSYCKYARVGLSTAKIEALGWQPKIKLIDGLRKTVLSFND